MSPRTVVGRVCLCIVALFVGPGAYFFDFNETHVYNPRWPPHARFHNGQTMSMGLYIAIAMMYFTWKQKPEPWIAALFSCAYWVSGLSAILYPGALFADPEFPAGPPQKYIFSGMIGITWLGCWLMREK